MPRPDPTTTIRVHGTVTIAGGAPATEVYVGVAGEVRVDEVVAGRILRRRGNVDVGFGRCATDGSYTIEVRAPADATLVVTAFAAGVPSTSRDLVEPGVDRTADLDLAGDFEWQARVVDPDGRPVSGLALLFGGSCEVARARHGCDGSAPAVVRRDDQFGGARVRLLDHEDTDQWLVLPPATSDGRGVGLPSSRESRPAWILPLDGDDGIGHDGTVVARPAWRVAFTAGDVGEGLAPIGPIDVTVASPALPRGFRPGVRRYLRASPPVFEAGAIATEQASGFELRYTVRAEGYRSQTGVVDLGPGRWLRDVRVPLRRWSEAERATAVLPPMCRRPTGRRSAWEVTVETFVGEAFGVRRPRSTRGGRGRAGVAPARSRRYRLSMRPAAPFGETAQLVAERTLRARCSLDDRERPPTTVAVDRWTPRREAAPFRGACLVRAPDSVTTPLRGLADEGLLDVPCVAAGEWTVGLLREGRGVDVFVSDGDDRGGADVRSGPPELNRRSRAGRARTRSSSVKRTTRWGRTRVARTLMT